MCNLCRTGYPPLPLSKPNPSLRRTYHYHACFSDHFFRAIHCHVATLSTHLIGGVFLWLGTPGSCGGGVSSHLALLWAVVYQVSTVVTVVTSACLLPHSVYPTSYSWHGASGLEVVIYKLAKIHSRDRFMLFHSDPQVTGHRGQ